MAIGFVLITTMPGEEERVRNALDDIEHVTIVGCCLENLTFLHASSGR